MCLALRVPFSGIQMLVPLANAQATFQSAIHHNTLLSTVPVNVAANTGRNLVLLKIYEEE
jgi:hypothetical protein